MKAYFNPTLPPNGNCQANTAGESLGSKKIASDWKSGLLSCFFRTGGIPELNIGGKRSFQEAAGPIAFMDPW